MSACVLCDWEYDPFGAPVAAYGPPESLIPLRWDGLTVRTCWLIEGLAETMADVALAAHWAREHTAQLRGLVDTSVELRVLGAGPGAGTTVLP